MRKMSSRNWCYFWHGPSNVQLTIVKTICGIYSAKECIRKAGNKDNFKDIEIMHKEDGRPFFKDCYISISHSAGMCIAICIQTQI